MIKPSKGLLFRVFFISLFLGCLAVPRASLAMDSESTPSKKDMTATANENENAQGLFSFFKNKSIDFFPVPVFETRPDEGQSYGLMPVVLFSDKETQAITTILAILGQWNSIIKFSAAGIAYYYPDPISNPNAVLELYFEFAQKYYKETYVRYFNPLFHDHFYLEGQFQWLQTPFPRFYGYGANTNKAAESDYMSRDYFFEATFGYYFLPNLRLSLTEKLLSTDINAGVITNLTDTLTQFSGLSGVNDSTNLIQQISLTYDTRPNLDNSRQGFLLEGSYFFSLNDLFSDTSFHGWSLESIYLKPFFHDRTVTALRWFMQDMYGSNIPFYLQSGLGGPVELRSYIPNRFRDTGKILLTYEQRIRVWEHVVFGIPFELHIDPFVELGRVFHHINNFNLNNLQPVGGIGIRGIVPPNVVARVDMAYGKEGYNVYTMLNYAF